MDKEQIMIDGVAYYKQQDINKGLDEEHYITEFHLLATHYNLLLEDYARKTQECEQIKEKFENLNNRQMVESAENLIYENSELIKNLEEKKQECEELKKQLMQKSEVDMFFNTPIEGWSNDPCGICPHKAENEELKKEIINKNEKIKELRFSVSDLTNRLCYLNAEKSFRIVDLEQTLDEIEKELKERLVRTEEDLKYQCVDCMNVKSDRYRKALEEIEGMLQLIVETNKVYPLQSNLYKILDIISRAKEEK